MNILHFPSDSSSTRRRLSCHQAPSEYGSGRAIDRAIVFYHARFPHGKLVSPRVKWPTHVFARLPNIREHVNTLLVLLGMG